MSKILNPTFIKAFFLNALGLLKKDPIFILGSGRCGSSLLVDVLHSNKAIKISQNEWYKVFLKTLEEGFNGSDFITDIIDFETITQQSVKSWSRIDKMYIKLILKYLSNYSGKVFFFKSPAISLMLPEIDTFFPNARYIHLYRNGYAVVNSVYKKEYFRVPRYRDKYTEIEFKKLAAKYWVLSTDAIDLFLKNKLNSIVFSYEDFTKNPKHFIDKIHSSFNVPGEAQFDYSSISSRNYKIDNLQQEEIATLTAIMKDTLQRKGYDVIK